MIARHRRIIATTATAIAVGTGVAGCGANQAAAVPNNSPTSVYSQRLFFGCTRAHKLISATSPLRKILKPLRDVPGVQGIIQIASGANPPPGISVGPPIDSVSLIFLRTPRQAQEGELQVWGATYDPRYSAIHPIPPKSIAPSLRSVRGNVVIIRAYPPGHHLVLTNRLLNDCFAASRT
jgi:hypothetical protein